MPKEDGTLEFDEWLEDELKDTEFDEGDTLETFSKLGKKVIEEELRKEEEARLRRLRKTKGNRSKSSLIKRS